MMLEGPSWEAMWPFLIVQEILQMRATVKQCNNATRYRPFREFFFFLMPHETNPKGPVPARSVSNESLFHFAQLDAQHPASQEALAGSWQWLCSSGHNDPGADSVRFACWACTRRFFFFESHT